ncbi:MAG: hypothetical protein C4334_13635 [Pyrinomonas sp.]
MRFEPRLSRATLLLRALRRPLRATRSLRLDAAARFSRLLVVFFSALAVDLAAFAVDFDDLDLLCARAVEGMATPSNKAKRTRTRIGERSAKVICGFNLAAGFGLPSDAPTKRKR